MQIEPLTGVWVVIRSDGSPVTDSIAYSKQLSISAFCNPDTWGQWEANGYQCIKVDIDFKIAKP